MRVNTDTSTPDSSPTGHLLLKLSLLNLILHGIDFITKWLVHFELIIALLVVFLSEEIAFYNGNLREKQTIHTTFKKLVRTTSDFPTC